jgi:hypothetical protein
MVISEISLKNTGRETNLKTKIQISGGVMEMDKDLRNLMESGTQLTTPQILLVSIKLLPSKDTILQLPTLLMVSQQTNTKLDIMLNIDLKDLCKEILDKWLMLQSLITTLMVRVQDPKSKIASGILLIKLKTLLILIKPLLLSQEFPQEIQVMLLQELNTIPKISLNS